MGLKIKRLLLISFESPCISNHAPDDWKRQTLISLDASTSSHWVFRGDIKPQTRHYISPQMHRSAVSGVLACLAKL
jgi:hypothetical protein